MGLILEGLKPITQDTLRECYYNVWEDEDGLYCMTPTIDAENIYSIKSSYYKNFLSVLENLDSYFDYIIIDIACFKGVLKTSLYRVCDILLVVINNDPASIFANLELVKNAKNFISANSKIVVLENKHDSSLISSDILKNEVLTSSLLLEDSYFSYSLKNSSMAGRWPGSGATFYSQSDDNLKEIMYFLSEKLDGNKIVISSNKFAKIFKDFVASIASYIKKLFTTYSSIIKNKTKKEIENKQPDKIEQPSKVIDYNASAKNDETNLKKNEDSKKYFTKVV